MQQPMTQREYWSGKVGDEWALNAERIDLMLAPLTEAVLDRAAFRAGERVLDIGCGAGQTSLEIARRTGAGGSVVGVDLSPRRDHRAPPPGRFGDWRTAVAQRMLPPGSPGTRRRR